MDKIELERPNRLKELFTKLKRKIEDIMLSLVLLLPEKMIPKQYLNEYLDREIAKAKHTTIKDKWDIVALDRAAKEIRYK